MWFDTHCHPYFDRFDEDQEQVFERATHVGVTEMLIVGCDRESNQKALKMAEEREGAWVSLGVHPCDVPDWTEEEAHWIKSTAMAHPKVVALGEMGLDYYHKDFSQEEQERIFRAQIQLAQELNLPCVVHSRDAAEDTLRILTEEKAERAVFHCFSYDLEFAKKVWNQGFYTSFSGVLTYPNAKELREVALHGPLDLFLIETDAPFLAPQAHRGQRNEMAYVVEVGKLLAELRWESIEEIAQKMTQNARDFFGITNGS